MLKIYIVSWILVQWICTSPPIKPNNYGIMSTSVPAVAYFKESKIYHEREFKNLKEAQLFIENAPKADSSNLVYSGYAYCTEIELDSTWVDTTMLRIRIDF